MIFYRCRTCALYLPQQQTCQLMPQMQGKIYPTDYCSKHMQEIEKCEQCGKGLLQPLIEVTGENNDEVHIYCPNCLMIRQIPSE